MVVFGYILECSGFVFEHISCLVSPFFRYLMVALFSLKKLFLSLCIFFLNSFILFISHFVLCFFFSWTKSFDMTCNLAINSLLFMICTLSLQFKHWAESALNLCLFSMWLFRSVLVLNLSSQTWQQISLSLLALPRLSIFLFKSIFSSFNYLDSVSFFSIVFSLVTKSKSFCLFAVFKFFIISSRSLSLFVNLSFSSSVLSLWLKGHKSFAKNLHLF